ADYLDTETARIDALIAKKQLLHASLLDRRAAVTYSAVRGDQTATGREFKDSGIPWLSAAPEHWRAAPLSLVAQLGSGHTPSRERPDWWLDCEIPWITTGEVTQMRSDRIEYISETRERISEVGLANSAAELHPASTVVLSRTASAGFSAIMGADMATSQDFVTWTCGPLLEPRFLLLCLRAMRTDLLERLAQGSTHKTIYMPDIKSIRIPLPPLEEQRQIVTRTWDEIRRIDDVVDRLDSQVQLLREHRQALITAAVTGEVDVPPRSA
ncbi:MAG: restriction endonuclease subunit S, partial [Actinomycetota bacterium]|nr:restriction endonuclease subunit S [Actinomycetota bacterium]